MTPTGGCHDQYSQEMMLREGRFYQSSACPHDGEARLSCTPDSKPEAKSSPSGNKPSGKEAGSKLTGLPSSQSHRGGVQMMLTGHSMLASGNKSFTDYRGTYGEAVLVGAQYRQLSGLAPSPTTRSLTPSQVIYLYSQAQPFLSINAPKRALYSAQNDTHKLRFFFRCIWLDFITFFCCYLGDHLFMSVFCVMKTSILLKLRRMQKGKSHNGVVCNPDKAFLGHC